MEDSKKLEALKGVKVFIGIDIGKRKHFISIIDRNGLEIIKGIEIDCNWDGFEELMSILKGLGKKENIAIAFEPTGHYFKTLAYFLKERGYRIYLINPYHVRLSKELRDNRQRKTDKKDAKLIAHLLREGKYLNTRLLEGEYENLRRLTITRERIVKELKRCKVRLKSILDEYLPEYENCFYSISIKTSLNLLKKYKVSGLRYGSRAAIEKDITLFSRRAISLKRAKEITTELKNSIGISVGLIGAEYEILTWVKQIENLNAEKILLEEKISKTLKETKEAKYLVSVDGIGNITAAVVLGQTGSFDDFSNAKKLEKLAGLDLVEHSSGQSQGLKRISKRGRDLLRHALYRITIVAITKNKEIKCFYQYKTNVLKKHKMVAITDLSVKLLRIMFALVKNESYYDGSLVIKGLPRLKGREY